MRTFKDIIRNTLIELDDTNAVVSEVFFKEHVGVSLKTFKKKLWKVDNAVDQLAFKVVEPKPSYPISVSFSKNENDKQTIVCTTGYYSALKQQISISVVLPDETYVSPALRFCLPANFLPEESSHNFLELALEVKEQNDNAFISKLKETYGDNWEFIYEQLMGFKQVFSILLSIEQLLFDEQNDAFHNSFSRQLFYEYFDLISTLKKWENRTMVSVIYLPYYSSVKSKNNEKKGFSFASCFLN